MQFDFSEELQRKLLALCIHSDSFIAAARGKLDPAHFISQEAWALSSLAFGYYDKFGTAPGDHIRNEIAKYVRRTRAKPERVDALMLMLESVGQPNNGDERYALSELDRYVKHAEARRVLEEFLPRFSTGEYDLDMDLLQPLQALSGGGGKPENSEDLLDNVRSRVSSRVIKSPDRPIATLIDPLDQRMNGITPGLLGTIMAPSGIGKTYFLLHLAKAAAFQGYSVLFYTLEMGVAAVSRRADRMLVGATKADLFDPHMTARMIQTAEAIAERGGGLQIVKPRWNRGGNRLDQLHDDFRQRKRDKDFRVVLVDYADLMAASVRSRYEELGVIWRGLSDFAAEECVAIWASTQSSRAGVGAKVITELEMGDSYEKVRVSDIVIGFNRNIVLDRRTHEWREIDEQYNERTVRLFMIKDREEGDKYNVAFACDFDRGLFYDKLASDEMAENDRKRAAIPLSAPKSMTPTRGGKQVKSGRGDTNGGI